MSSPEKQSIPEQIYAATFVREGKQLPHAPGLQRSLCADRAASQWVTVTGYHEARPPPQVTCIHPAELGRVGVEGQPVGQAQVALHEDPPVCAVQVGSFDFGAISVPVRPVKVPGGGQRRERRAGVSARGKST